MVERGDVRPGRRRCKASASIDNVGLASPGRIAVFNLLESPCQSISKTQPGVWSLGPSIRQLAVIRLPGLS
jgi:hypothetical protein